MATEEGYVDISIIVDGVDAFAETYGDGEELEAEAFREGIVRLGKMVTNEVEMFVQYHGHPVQYLGEPVEDCTCAQMADSNNRWTNRKGAI